MLSERYPHQRVPQRVRERLTDRETLEGEDSRAIAGADTVLEETATTKRKSNGCYSTSSRSKRERIGGTRLTIPVRPWSCRVQCCAKRTRTPGSDDGSQRGRTRGHVAPPIVREGKWATSGRKEQTNACGGTPASGFCKCERCRRIDPTDSNARGYPGTGMIAQERIFARVICCNKHPAVVVR